MLLASIGFGSGALPANPSHALRLFCRSFGLAFFLYLDDPRLPPDAVAEFRALAPRPDSIRTALLIARHMPQAAFQTLDTGQIDDLPVLVMYSANYGDLVSEGETPEEMARMRQHRSTMVGAIRRDRRARIAQAQATSRVLTGVEAAWIGGAVQRERAGGG